jgi:RsiW-degrading membrane proteinase PrsW (M82 family)
MGHALIVLLAVAPCLFWLWTVVRHDDHEREPWGLVVLALLLGAASAFGVLWTRPLLEGLFAPLSLAVDAFVVTAANEELWKLMVLAPVLLCNEVDEPLDGAVYGAAVGLGFAGCENVFFGARGGGAELLLQRAFTATLIHAACTGCLGLAWAEGKLRRFGVGTVAWLVFGLVVAIGLHGMYDVFLTGDRAQAMVALLGVLPVAIVLLAVKVRWARRRSEQFHPGR